ncbi:hypothetical protein FOYG_07749 [Fusarium oxysporum NRRL 32931]|uniref:Uncharacterized protein n=1 Tax=Fusarium oxysporum NRRL 32931 TaxID=660029 RepID=W9IB73_FUSOX|nr:hypothetical protein FOYG_07749 [Fusarium oxysporum NRRL 32931]
MSLRQRRHIVFEPVNEAWQRGQVRHGGLKAGAR